MKYLLQLSVMLGDLILLAASLTLLYFTIKNPNILLIALTVFLLVMSYRTWKETGGILAWTKKGRTDFYKNWDEITRIR